MNKKKEPRFTNYIYFAELALKVGHKLLTLPKNERMVNGKEISICSGAPLFSALQNETIACWKCGCKADRWILMRGMSENPFTKPVLNLFALKNNRLIMLTRDHIIPKSVGGMDDPKNLRPACLDCNGTRGNELTGFELEFALNHPDLIHPHRQQVGIVALEKSLSLLRDDQQEEKNRLRQPFVALKIIA